LLFDDMDGYNSSIEGSRFMFPYADASFESSFALPVMGLASAIIVCKIPRDRASLAHPSLPAGCGSGTQDRLSVGRIACNNEVRVPTSDTAVYLNVFPNNLREALPED
jgi:hypothetical protein